MSNFLKWTLVILGAAAIGGLGVIGVTRLQSGAGVEVHTQQTQTAAQSQQGGQAPPQTLFDEHIRKGNIVTCAGTFSGLGREMSENFSYTVQSQWDAKAGNDHAIQSLVALTPRPGAPTRQPDAGVVFAAPVGSACEAQVVRVTPVARSCQDVAAQLARSKGQNSSVGDLSLSTMPGGAQVMLIPFDAACVTVTVLKRAQ